MRIIVLNDGETYTNAEDCLMLDVPEWVDDDDVKTISTIIRRGYTTNGHVEVFVDNKDHESAEVDVIARF